MRRDIKKRNLYLEQFTWVCGNCIYCFLKHERVNNEGFCVLHGWLVLLGGDFAGCSDFAKEKSLLGPDPQEQLNKYPTVAAKEQALMEQCTRG